MFRGYEANPVAADPFYRKSSKNNKRCVKSRGLFFLFANGFQPNKLPAVLNEHPCYSRESFGSIGYFNGHITLN